MRINEWLRLIAGLVVLLALLLGATLHPYWNLLAVLVSVNLIQSAFTCWCPMMARLRQGEVQGRVVLQIGKGG